MFLTFHFEIHTSLDLGDWNFLLETFYVVFLGCKEDLGRIPGYHSFPNNWIVPVILVKRLRKLLFSLSRYGA
jgi:hypothetical protein